MRLLLSPGRRQGFPLFLLEHRGRANTRPSGAREPRAKLAAQLPAARLPQTGRSRWEPGPGPAPLHPRAAGQSACPELREAKDTLLLRGLGARFLGQGRQTARAPFTGSHLPWCFASLTPDQGRSQNPSPPRAPSIPHPGTGTRHAPWLAHIRYMWPSNCETRGPVLRLCAESAVTKPSVTGNQTPNRRP